MATTLHFDDRPLLTPADAAKLPDGRHTLNGGKNFAHISADIKGGKVTGYHADSGVETFMIRVEAKKHPAGTKTLMSEGHHCMLCCVDADGAGVCRPYPCPGGSA